MSGSEKGTLFKQEGIMRLPGFVFVFGIIGSVYSFKNGLIHLGCFCLINVLTSILAMIFLWHISREKQEDK
jgi:hypothetical protein